MPQPQPVNRRKRFFVELSRTQLLITIAAALFILSWVFILGIIVGRGIVADTITQAMKAQITKLQQEKKALLDKYMPSEQPAAGPQGEILKPQLDFYDQLGKKNQEHLVMTAPKPTAAPPADTAPSATVLSPPAAEKATEKAQGKMPPASPLPTPAASPTPAPTPSPAGAPGSAAGLASPSQAVPAPTAVKPSAPVAGKSPAAPPAEKTRKEPPPSAAETAGTFNLQIGSYRTEATAQTVAQRLSSKGYHPRVSSQDIPEKGGKWFRVRIGPYKTKSEAENILKKLEQDGFQALLMGKKN
jgi:cell division protein FtsN